MKVFVFCDTDEEEVYWMSLPEPPKEEEKR